jgi:hypothetical protein
MVGRGLIARVPIWVRVPVIILVVLTGIVFSSALLDATSLDNHGPGEMDHGPGDMEMEDDGHGPGDGGDHGSDDRDSDRGDHGSDEGSDGGDHGSDEGSERSNHNGSQGGSAPSTPDPAAVATQVVTFTIDRRPVEGLRVEGARS